MADGSGMSVGQVKRVNLFPELIKGSCTIIGAWGPATSDGNLLQMRALDWDPKGPMNKYPMISIYHSNVENSQVFANFGWVGLAGSLAGFSTKLGVSQKVWRPYEGNLTSRYGTPWMYVLRDLLQFGTDLASSVEMLESADRTWQMFLGVGSVEDNKLLGFEYAAKELIVYDDQNYTTPYPEAHPQLDGIVYWDRYVQPSNNSCVGENLKESYGNITAEFLFRTIGGLSPTGNTLSTVFDFKRQSVYISFADYETGNPAYNRSMTFLNMTQLFNIEV